MLNFKNDLYKKISEGIELSLRRNKCVIITHIERIAEMDLLRLLSLAQNDFDGERFFWSDSSRKLTFLGLGYLLDLVGSKKENRFLKMDEIRRRITGNILHSGEEHEVGVKQPILFGGFSFLNQSSDVGIWEDFGSSKFVLPAFLLTQKDGDSYLTINIRVEGNDDENELINLLEAKLSLLDKIVERQEKYRNRIIIEEEVGLQNWNRSVEKAKKEIDNGKIEKVVLARELKLELEEKVELESVLKFLMKNQLESYIFAMESGKSCFIGATPERVLKKNGMIFSTMCLAGTIGRGKIGSEDDLLGDTLLNDDKNFHEHNLVVEMIRETMENDCSDLVFPGKPELLKLRNVQHLKTAISGRGSETLTLFELMEKLHPTPALGGFPREEALDFIEKEEMLDRGWYAAPLGWVDSRGDGEFVAAIRSGLIRERQASLFAGCGIVVESDLESEYQESVLKFKAMKNALRGGEDEQV